MSYDYLNDPWHTGLNLSLAVVTPPTDEPVTIDDLKAQVWIDADADVQVALATKQIKAARAQCERWCGRSFAPQTYLMTLDRFPFDDGVIYLRKPPVTAVTSITYTDVDGNEQTLSPDNYILDLNPNEPRIALKKNSYWPSTASQICTVKIHYTAGYTADTLPTDGWNAILLVAADMFENRWAQTDRQLYQNARAESLLWGLRLV